MTREQTITKALRRYDDKLCAAKDDFGVISLYRNSTTYDIFDWEGQKLYVSRPFRHYIMSLTHNWNIRGNPVDWGLEPIMARIKAMDLWQNDRMAIDLEAEHEKVDKSKERDFSNTVESFLYDFRSQFAKATDGINTSTLAKLDKRRLENGYSK